MGRGNTFSSFSFSVTGAVINGNNYGSPSTTLIPNANRHYNWNGQCTFTALSGLTVTQGGVPNLRRYRLAFVQFSEGSYSGTYPDSSERITISGNVVTVDTTYKDYSEQYSTGVQNFIAEYTWEEVFPGDPEYDDGFNYYVILVKASPSNGGTVSGNNSTAQAGHTYTISASPNSGYRFTHWTSSDGDYSTDSTHSFTMPSHSIEWTAHFELEQPPTTYYTVTVNADPVAGGSVSGGGQYEAGATCTITATPNSGYYFVKWTSSDGEVSTNNPHPFTVTKNITWTAKFHLCTNLLLHGSSGTLLHGSSGTLLHDA